MKFKVVGGEAPNAAQIAPKLSPLGVNPKKVGDDIQKMTKEWKGIKVMIELRVQNREAHVTLLPTAAGQVIKAMGEPARDRKKQKIRKVVWSDPTIEKHATNMTMEQIKDIATIVKARSKAKDFKGTVKEVLGAWYGFTGCE